VSDEVFDKRPHQSVVGWTVRINYRLLCQACVNSGISQALAAGVMLVHGALFLGVYILGE